MIRKLDWLICLLILFPIIGGGFWISRPHFKFELTELAVPTIIVFALGAVFRMNWRESFFVGAALSIFGRWRSATATRPGSTLLAGTAAVAALWALASLRRHWNLETDSFDMGIFTNAIWNLTHGHGYISSIKGGMNLFADHQSPIFWVLYPVFSLFPHPETLLIVQAAALAAGSGAVFALSRQYSSPEKPAWWPAALPLLYWAYLPIRRANQFDFHPEIFMLPLFLWAIAGIQSRSRPGQVLGWLAFACALGCKESAGPIAAGIGLGWFVGAGPEGSEKPARARGAVAAALGVSAFVFDLKIVPMLLGGQYVYASLYSHLFTSVTPTLGLLEWLRSLFGLTRWQFLFATLAPLGFIPLLAPRAMIATIPAYLMLFLTEGSGRLNPSFHYGIEVAVGLFWALAVARPRAPKKIPLALWMLFWGLFSFGRSEIYWIRHSAPTEHVRWLTHEMAPCLANDTRLTASSPLVPQVATREWIQQIPDLAGNDCVWIDDSVKPWPLNREERVSWEKHLMESAEFTKFYECGPTRVYQRQKFTGACLSCLPICAKSD